ncbi:hypothetical protein ASG29_09265 [Sphingomonas sp. Leaf412]|uniref:winged helix-turn-helix domain-containing protein n=1 Tax=Sphingomonas sp. Leaf412 TaxID=1736370 RepID=UPI00072900B1|nr:winged helix-turn-helix domain-containing protein [Sphingomonas sp. Leaf412]KQT32034.1 hypothetical protein ASG29_09265 [Sphingomonas sp. Leaf412]
MGVQVLIDRPGVTVALAARGVAAGQAVLVAHAGAVPSLRLRHPHAAMLAVAADGAGEAAALDAGADDAVAGGAPDALVAIRAERLLASRGGWRVGALSIDPVARDAWREGRRLAPLPREYALLAHLARHAGETVAHADLYRAVFGLRFAPGTNVLAAQVSRLRARLDRGFAFPMLLTDRARGYRLVAAAERAG